MNAYDWHADVRARIEAHLADGQNPCSTSDDVVLRLLAERDVERARADAAEADLARVAAHNAALRVRATQLAEALDELCERVGDFKTAYTGEEGWRIIPDMLAAMEDELPRARAALAVPQQETPTK